MKTRHLFYKARAGFSLVGKERVKKELMGLKCDLAAISNKFSDYIQVPSVLISASYMLTVGISQQHRFYR